MIFEKAEPESTVFSSDGRRYMYGIVLYELPVFCSEPEGFCFNRKCTDERKKGRRCALICS